MKGKYVTRTGIISLAALKARNFFVSKDSYNQKVTSKDIRSIVRCFHLENIIFGFSWRAAALLARFPGFLNAQVGICVADVLQEGVVLLADEGLLVMAGNIVPVDTVIVELVQQGQAVLRGAVLLEFTVVGLGQADSAGGRPITLGALRGRGQFLEGGGPEPSVDVRGLEVWAIAALEVAQAATGPDVFHLKNNKY